MNATTWQHRLPDRQTDDVFEALNASTAIDGRLFREEIAATKAHACALRETGIYTADECAEVRAALCRIEGEIAGGEFDLSGFEDIHSAVEFRLTELTGGAGKKIQTGRSRNEQTVTAQRLYMRDALVSLDGAVAVFQQELVNRAEEALDVVMPGTTHLRPAQPLRFAHYLCAQFFGLQRDRGRFASARHRLNKSSAGVGALAGATFGLDRSALAEALGFSGVSENSLDTVSDRDGQLEVLSSLAILMVRLSRFAEDLILWSSPSHGFLELGDTYCTSSSLMPQKKNPDGLELVRGKTGRVIADLVSLLVTCKGLPTGYQKDLQEDKEPLFDAVDTATACLKVCAGVVREMTVNGENMADAITEELLATDRADALVAEGVPFREAYSQIAAAANDGALSGKADLADVEASVERRDGAGGTSRKTVQIQIENAKLALAAG